MRASGFEVAVQESREGRTWLCVGMVCPGFI